jgi:hypothetical protein
LALHFGLNRFGKEKNRAKINRFELVFGSVRFGSVQKLKKIIIGLVVYFDPKPDRTGPKMLNPSADNMSS